MSNFKIYYVATTRVIEHESITYNVVVVHISGGFVQL